MFYTPRRILYALLYTPYTVCFTLYVVYCTLKLCVVYCTLYMYAVYCILYIVVHWMFYTVRRILYTVRCTLDALHCAPYSVRRILYVICCMFTLYDVYSMLYNSCLLANTSNSIHYYITTQITT